jgi:uncharacterized membrane protein
VSTAQPSRDISRLRTRRRQARRRRRRLAGLDLGLGLLTAIALLLATPGLAIVAAVALLVLVFCILSVALERRVARRSANDSADEDQPASLVRDARPLLDASARPARNRRCRRSSHRL